MVIDYHGTKATSLLILYSPSSISHINIIIIAQKIFLSIPILFALKFQVEECINWELCIIAMHRKSVHGYKLITSLLLSIIQIFLAIYDYNDYSGIRFP